MSALLAKYAAAPDAIKARRIANYNRKHPFSTLCLNSAERIILAIALSAN